MGSNTVVIYAGAKAPESLIVTMKRKPGSSFDATTVTACEFVVRTETGDEVTWPATISSSSPDQVVASHTFDELGLETATPGRYRLFPYMTLAGGGQKRGVPLNLVIEP